MKGFGKSALRYGYSWEPLNKNILLDSFHPEDIIDRKNGFALLNFINRFMAVHGLDTLDSFQKLEWMVCKFLPHDLDLRADMEQWLRKNWSARMYY